MQLPRMKRVDIDADPAPYLARGWREIEEFVTYEREPSGMYGIPRMRVADHWDFRAVRAMASSAFSEDRLHRDPEVPDDEADRFKVECVDRAIREKLPILLYDHPSIKGFLVMRPQGNVSVLDLMAVSPDERGNGIGTTLVEGFVGASMAFGICRAATQAHNAAAMKIYRRRGFYEVKRERTFHRP